MEIPTVQVFPQKDIIAKVLRSVERPSKLDQRPIKYCSWCHSRTQNYYCDSECSAWGEAVYT